MMKNIRKHALIVILVSYAVGRVVLFLVAGKHTNYNGTDPEYNRLSGYKTVAATDTAIR
jgi:hypothetical protein